MIVYRVQDNRGRGPFVPGFSSSWVEARVDLELLPPFYVEFGAEILNSMAKPRNYAVACRTKDQLRRWFIEAEMARLENHGYSAVEIKIDEIVAESGIQMVVSREKDFGDEAKQIKLY